MKVLSVNVGLPRFVEYRGKPVATGIYKEPVAGRVAVGKSNLAGDAQADLGVHGGYYKAVYLSRRSIMNSGAKSCQRWICHSAFSLKI